MNRQMVAAFYAFTPLNDERRESILAELPPLARQGDVLGSVLVADEGVNGTISGPAQGVDALLSRLRERLALGAQPFERLEVKRS